ncbi:MAG TPA: DUF1501 domain-containing protein [Ktedonobacterales bacterium]|nr:DUF1501 domain-containing protein [Ktedonobacterales bacterium]
MYLTRRAMIKDGLLAVSAGMIMPPIFARAVRAAQNAADEGDRWAQAASGRTLIVVQMAGGNDGLNTVVPVDNPMYAQVRPHLALTRNDVTQLSGNGPYLHSALAPLHALWDGHKLAIVEGVGYEHSSLSHFQAMDVWQTLDLAGHGTSGWLGRYAAGLIDKDGHPFQSLAIGTSLPMALQSINVPVPVLANPAQYRLQGDGGQRTTAGATDPRIQALLNLYNTYPQSAPYAALLRPTAENFVAGSTQLASAASQYTPQAEYDPADGFAQGLKVLAEVIVNDLGLRVGYVTLGGFDTHSDQTKRQADLLAKLAAGLAAFYQDLSAHGKSQDVVVMTWSEFGRRVHENASQGTDHGTAAPMFVVGDAVNGGVFGAPPDLGDLDTNQNLKSPVDFRSVYATVLNWLGAPASTILNGSFSGEGFLPAAS